MYSIRCDFSELGTKFLGFPPPQQGVQGLDKEINKTTKDVTHVAFSSSPPQGLEMRLYCLTTIFSIDLLSHPLTITLYSVHLSVQCRGLLGEVMGTPVKQDDVTTKRGCNTFYITLCMFTIFSNCLVHSAVKVESTSEPFCTSCACSGVRYVLRASAFSGLRLRKFTTLSSSISLRR